MKVIKRNGEVVDFDKKKIRIAIRNAFNEVNVRYPAAALDNVLAKIYDEVDRRTGEISVEGIQDIIERILMRDYPDVAKAYIVYRFKHKAIREFVESKEKFISNYKASSNTANATIDDNSNVASKNIGILNNEIHKQDNIQVSRGMVMRKLKQLYPDFDSKQYIRDLLNHILYKHDESSFAGALAPYCVSASMYPFLLHGLKDLGGLSAAPKNIDSFCGMYINYVFAVSSQFAGAVATSEFLLYFDYFARKEWGNSYFKQPNTLAKVSIRGNRTIRQQIHQHFQQVIYSINQPAAARGMQAAFVNFSYFDKPFFEGMFGNFYFPDGTQPQWESLDWLQREFMQWFNEERLRTVLTFPVESFALVYQDGHFLDQESADFVAEEYARGHSFFTYISDSVDSLSSCCRLKNKIQTKEFNFTNGNMGIETGSKSVITINLNRITQNALKRINIHSKTKVENLNEATDVIISEIRGILERVYKYHHAYNELLWDMYDANLLPVYKAGFIDLNKQYLTIGINGLNEAAEYMGLEISDNADYQNFCQSIFSAIKHENELHKVTEGHKMTFNTECVPAESLAAKNYNWDKADGYWVPADRNLYASYIYIPSDNRISILEKIRMHGSRFIGDFLDGGSAAHLNMDSHLSAEQYKRVLNYAALEGCSYLTFNVPISECTECGFITRQPIIACPHCGSTHIDYWDRIIGYLTRVRNWSSARQIEQKNRFYEDCSGRI